jgi:hypothetical protein
MHDDFIYMVIPAYGKWEGIQWIPPDGTRAQIEIGGI